MSCSMASAVSRAPGEGRAMPSALKHDNNHSRVAQASTPSRRRLLQSAGGSSRRHLSARGRVCIVVQDALERGGGFQALPKQARPLCLSRSCKGAAGGLGQGLRLRTREAERSLLEISTDASAPPTHFQRYLRTSRTARSRAAAQVLGTGLTDATSRQTKRLQATMALRFQDRRTQQ